MAKVVAAVFEDAQDARKKILRRLTKGEGAAAAGEGGEGAKLPPPPSVPAAVAASSAAGKGRLSEVFAEAARANYVEVVFLSSARELPPLVAAFLQKSGAKRADAVAKINCEEGLLMLPWAAAGLAATSRAPTIHDLCGVTGVEAAAADIGAMLLTDSPGAGGAVSHRLTLSLTPPYHVAVLQAADILPDLPAVWRRLPKPLPRGCVLVSGPSRTADIEQTLTLGAHGPIKMLTAVVG